MRINLQPLVVAALSLLVVAGGGAAAVELQPDAAAVVVTQQPPAQEDPVPAACLPQPRPATAPGTTGGQAGHTGVSFVVPPSTVVVVDHLGQPVAVSTNTGQAPCVTDLFVQVGPDGARAAAGEALRSAVLEQRWAGPWTPGVAQPLTVG